MNFNYSVRNAAYIRQGQRCAKCGKNLDWPSEDNPQHERAWTAHALDEGGSNRAFNCVLLCTTDPDCHLNYAHGGTPNQLVVLSQFNFPYWVSKRGVKQAWYEIDVPVGQKP
jgi:hypothetical protein